MTKPLSNYFQIEFTFLNIKNFSPFILEDESNGYTEQISFRQSGDIVGEMSICLRIS